jgi:hypothetical protein
MSANKSSRRSGNDKVLRRGRCDVSLDRALCAGVLKRTRSVAERGR